MNKEILWESHKGNKQKYNDNSNRQTVASHAYEVIKKTPDLNNNDSKEYFDVEIHDNNNKIDFKKTFHYKKPLSTIESLTNYSVKDFEAVSPPQKEHSTLTDYTNNNYNLNYIEINKANLDKLFSTPKSLIKDDDSEISERINSENERYSEMVKTLESNNSDDHNKNLDRGKTPKKKSISGENQSDKLSTISSSQIVVNTERKFSPANVEEFSSASTQKRKPEGLIEQNNSIEKNELENPFTNVKPIFHRSSKEFDDKEVNNENEDEVESLEKDNKLGKKLENKNKKRKKRTKSIISQAESLNSTSLLDDDDDGSDEEYSDENFYFDSDNAKIISYADWDGFLKELGDFDYGKLLREYETKNNLKINSDELKNLLADKKQLL